MYFINFYFKIGFLYTLNILKLSSIDKIQKRNSHENIVRILFSRNLVKQKSIKDKTFEYECDLIKKVSNYPVLHHLHILRKWSLHKHARTAHVYISLAAQQTSLPQNHLFACIFIRIT